MKIKTQRILLTIGLSLISIPFLINLIFWILIPKNYQSDGVTDFGYGFLSLVVIFPITWIVSTIIIWFILKGLYRRWSKNPQIKVS
jgi:heme/copper-type cytochrome/quinol oxidase subunit 2